MSENLDSQNVEWIGHSDVEGHGNGGQVVVDRRGDEYYAFIGHMKGMGTSIINVTDPEKPETGTQLPIPEKLHSHKVRVCGNVMLVNSEYLGGSTGDEGGLRLYDISDIKDPKELSFFRTGGKGVHRFWCDCEKKLAYISTEMDGYNEAIFMIVDFSNPRNPFEVSRWWLPGQWVEGGETPTWDPRKESVRHHHPVVMGNRAYLGYWDAGYIILDLTDIRKPSMITWQDYSPPYGGAFHTALPINRMIMDRKWLVVFQESIAPYHLEGKKLMWMVDITKESNPVSVETFQAPEENYVKPDARFGPHQPFEDISVKNNLIYGSWFNAGLRIIDVSNPYSLHEVGHFVPPSIDGQTSVQTNDVCVDDRDLIYIIDRLGAGMDILRFKKNG